HEVVDSVGDDVRVHLSAGSASAFASSAALSPAPSSCFDAFFLLLTASPKSPLSASASAALNRSSLDCFSPACLRVPSAPGSPLNFCQSPVTFSRASTGSVGCAPTPSQYCARSESISIRLGSSLGW